MTFMRAAIAGKPDEQFPAGEIDGQMLKAAAAPAANPRRVATAPSSLARGLKPGAAVKPVLSPRPIAPSAMPPAKSPTQPGNKPVVRLAVDVPGADSQVRPALPPEPAPAKPRGTVKPALDNPRR
jgi:hypothetical protein